ncbi:MAG: Bax inhibitor-1 family protein [Planctomycetaceae bacterium]
MSYDVRYDTAEMDAFAADAAADERVAFLRRVYAHLGGATLLFAGLATAILSTPALAQPLARLAAGHWWVVLVAYIGAGWVAQRMAESNTSEAVQYAGLALFALAQAVIFTPLLYMLHEIVPGGDDVIIQAGLLTLTVFGGLTAVALFSRTDFSFLRGMLSLGMLIALGLAITAAFTQLNLGTWFVVAMIGLMAGYILYETSNVLHHYHTSQHVAASLALFASLTTLFWYVLRLTSYLNLGDD